MRPLVLLLVLRAVAADWSPLPLFAMRFDGIQDRRVNRTSDGRLLQLHGSQPRHPAPFIDQRPLGQAKVHLDKDKCRVTSRTGRDQLLVDEFGNVLLYRQFIGRQPKKVCSEEVREKRQISSLAAQIAAANVNVKAFDTNTTVTQLINITSGQSLVSVNERYVTSAFYSDASDVLIDPNNEFVNMSVVKPFSLLNIGQNSSQLDMTADRSDVFVRTNHTGDEHSYMMIQSGASNLSLTHGTSRLQALNAISSVVALNTWDLNIEERLTIASNLSSADGLDRYLSVLLLTKLAHIQITLVGALVRIRYGQTDLEISPDYRTVTIFTGNHTVILNTVTSPFNILITESELDIRVPNDDVVLTVNPITSDINGSMGQLSLMQIRPDANTTLRIGGSEGEPSALSGIADAEIDVTSRSLGIEVVSSTNSILAESNRSEALIKTNKTEIGVQARHARIDIVAGRPRILITTGNSTIEINSNAPNFTTALLPPYTTPANIFTNIGPFDGSVVPVTATTTPRGIVTTSSTASTASITQQQTTTSNAASSFTTTTTGTTAIVNTTGGGSTTTTLGGGITTGETGVTTAAISFSTTSTTTVESGILTTTTTVPDNQGGSSTTAGTTATMTSSGGGVTLNATSQSVPTTTTNPLVTGGNIEGNVTTIGGGASSTTTPLLITTISGGPAITTTTTVESGGSPWTTTIDIFEFQQFNLTTASLQNSSQALTTASSFGSTTTTTTTTSTLTTTTTAIPGGPTLPGGADLEIFATVAAIQTPLESPVVERDTLLSGPEINVTNTNVPFPLPPDGGLFSGPIAEITSTVVPFPLPDDDEPLELLTNGSSSMTPFPPPFTLPIELRGGLTPSPTEAPTALPLRRARMVNPPPSADYLLSVGIKVDQTMDSSTEQFFDSVVDGLHKGYVDGRRLQLGLTLSNIARVKRQATIQTQNDTMEPVEIMVTSLDRLPEIVRTRFFVKSGEDLILATNAAETYSKITSEELSALIEYPVIESVEPVTAQSTPISRGQTFVTVIILVAIAALLLVIGITILLCYKAQKRQVSLTKRILQCYPQRSARRTSPILPPVPDSLRERLNSPSAIVGRMEAGHIVVKGEDERAESRASSGASQLAFIEYPAPPDSADGHLLLRQLSAKDRVHFPTAVDSPRSIVLPEPDSNYTNRRLTIPASSRKVSPLPSPIPINHPEVWADELNANRLGEVPPSRNLKENIFRVSAAKSSERRSTARRLLDSAFPLTTVDIERFIESK